MGDFATIGQLQIGTNFFDLVKWQRTGDSDREPDAHRL